MRVYLDDCREMPEGFDCQVYTAQEAILLIETGLVTHISLDFDLGWAEHGPLVEGALWAKEDPDAPTGRCVTLRIITLAANNLIPRITWELHTANPVGRVQMHDDMRFADYQWEYWEGRYGGAKKHRQAVLS